MDLWRDCFPSNTNLKYISHLWDFRFSRRCIWRRLKIFWNIAQCNLAEIRRRFRGSYSLHHKGNMVQHHRRRSTAHSNRDNLKSYQNETNLTFIRHDLNPQINPNTDICDRIEAIYVLLFTHCIATCDFSRSLFFFGANVLTKELDIPACTLSHTHSPPNVRPPM
jgi:hypothetical protein